MTGVDHESPGANEGGVDFAQLAALRREAAVCPVSSGGWYVGRQKELVDALKDTESFRADLSFGATGIPDEALFLSEIPEPRHGQIRRIYNAQFGPHKIARIEPFVRALCASLLDELLAQDAPDLVSHYTSLIPSGVIAHVIGVPPGDAEQFVAWSNENLMLDRGGADEAEPPMIQRYITALMAERRGMDERPEDVINGLLEGEVEGARLSDVEILTQIQFIVASAVETTRKLLANLFSLLLVRPDLYADLRRDRSLVPAAIEETMRFLSPVQSTPRKIMRDAALGEARLGTGETLMIGIGSANRDENVYEDPEVFRLDRANPRNHVGFGAGPHVCPGASLARLESTVALEMFVDRVTELAPVPGFAYEPLPTPDLHRPHALPVVLVPD